MTRKKNSRINPGVSKFTQAAATEICERLSEGETLMQICRDKGLAWRTVYQWTHDHPDFARDYQRARDIGMDAILEQTLAIADETKLGTTKTYKGNDVEVREEDMLGHRKLQIETRLKLLAKWNPKKYGDSVTHRGDPAAPVQLILSETDVKL